MTISLWVMLRLHWYIFIAHFIAHFRKFASVNEHFLTQFSASRRLCRYGDIPAFPLRKRVSVNARLRKCAVHFTQANQNVSDRRKECAVKMCRCKRTSGDNRDLSSSGSQINARKSTAIRTEKHPAIRAVLDFHGCSPQRIVPCRPRRSLMRFQLVDFPRQPVLIGELVRRPVACELSIIHKLFGCRRTKRKSCSFFCTCLEPFTVT